MFDSCSNLSYIYFICTSNVCACYSAVKFRSRRIGCCQKVKRISSAHWLSSCCKFYSTIKCNLLVSCILITSNKYCRMEHVFLKRPWPCGGHLCVTEIDLIVKFVHLGSLKLLIYWCLVPKKRETILWLDNCRSYSLLWLTWMMTTMKIWSSTRTQGTIKLSALRRCWTPLQRQKISKSYGT